MLIKGQDVELIEKAETGTDELGNPTFEEATVVVPNVVISPTSDADAVDELNLYGKKSTYTLCIPKGDTHKWTDTTVRFFGQTWRTFGGPVTYQEELVPLDWNTKVKVERYE